MSDLISKEKLRYDIAMLIMNNNSLIDTWLANQIDDIIDEAPTINAEPIKHGRWINVNEGKWNTIYVLQCSACGEIDSRMYLNDSYCPHCGARMDEVEE